MQHFGKLLNGHDTDVALAASFFDVVDRDASQPGQHTELGLTEIHALASVAEPFRQTSGSFENTSAYHNRLLTRRVSKHQTAHSPTERIASH